MSFMYELLSGCVDKASRIKKVEDEQYRIFRERYESEKESTRNQKQQSGQRNHRD